MSDVHLHNDESTIDWFSKIKDELKCEDQVAATLVLAQSIRYFQVWGSVAVEPSSDAGSFDVRLDGELETKTVEQPKKFVTAGVVGKAVKRGSKAK